MTRRPPPEQRRDPRFEVKTRWVDCVNLPDAHPERFVEFLHRQMNEEVNGLECAAAALCDFPEAQWEVRMSLARQCADEARHVLMFRRCCEERGAHLGKYPVLNFQYAIITSADTLEGHLAIQNRAFEAEGIDAIAQAIVEAEQAGDVPLRHLFDAQQAGEGHAALPPPPGSYG